MLPEGYQFSKEHRRKLKEAQTGKHLSEESKRKISATHKGKYVSEETKLKMSEAKKGNKYHFEHKHSEETKKKISQALEGEKATNWKGGISKTKGYDALMHARRKARLSNSNGNFTLGEWILLKKQYGYTCPMCKRVEPDIKLTIDHIIPLSKGGREFVV